MPSLAEWGVLFGASQVINSGFTALVLRTTRKSERGKLNADRAQTLVDISLKLLQPVSDELAEVHTKLDATQQDLDNHKAADAAAKRARQENAREHEAWDQMVAERLRENGIHVADPPTLFEGT